MFCQCQDPHTCRDVHSDLETRAAAVSWPNGPTIKKLEELHLQGILSGKFGQSIRQYPDVSLTSYDPGVVNAIYQNYLKALRDKLN
jgi:hypothetical protein